MSEFYKPLDGKKQLQEMMMNDTPTPETDHLESNLGYAAHPVLLYLCRKLESERDKARKELTAVTEQRDRLAEALQSVKCELGVPQPEYPSPVANAYEIADEALQSLTPTEP